MIEYLKNREEEENEEKENKEEIENCFRTEYLDQNLDIKEKIHSIFFSFKSLTNLFFHLSDK